MVYQHSTFFSLYAALVLIAHTPYARVVNLVVHHSRQFHFLLQTLADLGEIQIVSLVVKLVPVII